MLNYTNVKKIPSIIADYCRYLIIWQKHKHLTMVKRLEYLDSLYLAAKYSRVDGDIVECGVWKGGMSLGIIEATSGYDKNYHFFDSFEGLPPAQEIDGLSAIDWQNNREIQSEFQNCKSDDEDFRKELAKISINNEKLHVYKGFFEETLSKFPRDKKISVLRLDADWYQSTIECLEALYERVSEGGVIIIDDYYTWDGCSRAIHDFLAKKSVRSRVRQTRLGGIAFIVK